MISWGMLYKFKIPFLSTFIFILVFPVLVFLGFWQLDRAYIKKNWINSLEQGDVLSLNEALADPLQAQYKSIILDGVFLNTPPLLLMHQIHDGKPGAHVIHFFKIQGETTPILVNRGFIANPIPQEIPLPPGQPIAIRGIIDTPKPDRFILGNNILDPTVRPLPVQRLDVDELGALFHTNLLSLVILANQDLGDGLVRDWQITPRMPPEKHLGYAIQWFALALCLVILYLAVYLKKRPS